MCSNGCMAKSSIMLTKLKKFLVIIGICLLIIASAFVILLFTGIIWRSPAYYTVDEMKTFTVPVMDMKAYDSVEAHRQPYIYRINSGKGVVCVVGIQHTKDPDDPQLDSLRTLFTSMQPDVVFVEGKLGFLLAGMQNPVKLYGENGETVRLAKQYKVPYYTWEPPKEEEVRLLAKKYPGKQLALFYSLRPYFSNYRFGKPSDPEKQLQQYINSRTDYTGLRGMLKDVKEVDSIWDKDFPQLKNWRETSDEFGWPPGYLSEIFNDCNLIRDNYLCNALLQEAKKGKHVFVTMGSSHAYRIEKTLEAALAN